MYNTHCLYNLTIMFLTINVVFYIMLQYLKYINLECGALNGFLDCYFLLI